MDSSVHLKKEFYTVDLLLNSRAATAYTDGFILAWTKWEKQMRKLFTYLVYQSTSVAKDYVKITIANSRDLYAKNFMNGFDSLYQSKFDAILGDHFRKLWPKLCSIEKHRNKILHGLLTGQDLTRRELLRHTETVREWCRVLGERMCAEVGYDGLARNSLQKSTSVDLSSRLSCNLATIPELERFVGEIAQRKYRRYPPGQSRTAICANGK